MFNCRSIIILAFNNRKYKQSHVKNNKRKGRASDQRRLHPTQHWTQPH